MLVQTVELLEATPRRPPWFRSRKPLVQRRRIPGHQPAVRNGSSSCGSAIARSGGGRRSGPNDLHLHRRHAGSSCLGFADRLPVRAPSRSPRTTLQPADPRAGQPARCRAGPRGGVAGNSAQGPAPVVHRFADAEAEIREIVAWDSSRGGRPVWPAAETAVLVRITPSCRHRGCADTRRHPFTVRGSGSSTGARFRESLRLLRRERPAGDRRRAGPPPSSGLFRRAHGLDERPPPTRGSERPRTRPSLELLLGILEDLAAADPAARHRRRPRRPR